MNWYLKVIVENYANFSGRARRQEYWMFVLIQIVIFFIIGFVSTAIDDLIGINISNILFLIYLLGTLVPWLALNARRLHDTGKSGTYFFINLIPIIGRIWYIVLVATNGDIGSNRYGPDPKGNFDDEIEDIGKPLLGE